MFFQVYVNEEHRNLFCFRWWDNGDLQKEPTEYRMRMHLFGATSLPGCANIALKASIDDIESECGSYAAHFVRNHFYVDDGLISLSMPSEAVNLVSNTQALCKKGGFHLHMFMSNNKEVLRFISPRDLAKGIQELDLTCNSLPVETTLGVQWCVNSDTLKFRIVVSEQLMTHRGILSTISSVYDPLGLLAPFVLIGKQILQELYKRRSGTRCFQNACGHVE